MKARPSRWWIAGVPFAIAAMLGSAGYRVHDLWFVTGEHHETTAVEPGEWATATWPYEDAHGDTSRTFSVRFAGWGEVSQQSKDNLSYDLTLPDGLVSRQVRLDFKADPSQALRYCALTLIDDQGREYAIGEPKSTIGAADPCAPLDWPGPSIAISKKHVRGAVPKGDQPRPASWSVSPGIVTPKDARFVALRLSYTNPNYLTLRLPR